MDHQQSHLAPEPFANSGEGYEALAKTNGTRYWLARELMVALGYDSWSAFRGLINKAIGVCMTAGIPVIDNFVQHRSVVSGREAEDFKLTRLAGLSHLRAPNLPKLLYCNQIEATCCIYHATASVHFR